MTVAVAVTVAVAGDVKAGEADRGPVYPSTEYSSVSALQVCADRKTSKNVHFS